LLDIIILKSKSSNFLFLYSVSRFILFHPVSHTILNLLSHLITFLWPPSFVMHKYTTSYQQEYLYRHLVVYITGEKKRHCLQIFIFQHYAGLLNTVNPTLTNFILQFQNIYQNQFYLTLKLTCFQILTI